MARRCEFCGKQTEVGRKIARRGKPKYQGGIGLKVTGTCKRTFKPNVQRVRARVNGTVRRVKVCTGCIRSGRVEKP